MADPRREVSVIFRRPDAGAKSRRRDAVGRDRGARAKCVVRELVDVHQAGPRDHQLHTDPSEDPAQGTDHLHLARRSGGEVGVPSFGGGRDEAAVDVVQHGLAKARARRDHGGIPFGERTPTCSDLSSEGSRTETP